jgi:hypothetical protein
MSESISHRAVRPSTRLSHTASGLGALASVSAITAGWLVAGGHEAVIVASAVAIAGVLAARYWPGPFVAAMVLVVMNAVPVVSLSKQLVGSFGIQDCAVLALAVGLHCYRGKSASGDERRIARIATIWSACLVAWWLITFARSVLLYGIPMRYAASYGRDFLYFAVLLPLAVRAQLPLNSLRRGALLLMAGVVAFAAGQIVSSLSGHELSWLVHPVQSVEASGLLRVYSPMSTVVSMFLIFAAAWLLAGGRVRRRVPAASLVMLLGVSVALQLTRSNYAAIIVALVTGVAVHSIRGGSFTAVIMRVAMTVLVVALVVITMGFANVGDAGIGNVATRVAERAESGVSAVSNSNGTFGYRTNLDAKMLHILGSQLPIGMGFLDPSAHYVAGLPDGAIRNADVGLFNALMTMGVIGAVFIYAPLLYAFAGLLRAAQSWTHLGLPERRWLACGGAAWIAWALAGSWNLIVLFSVPGLVVTALALGLLANATAVASVPRGAQCDHRRLWSHPQATSTAAPQST